MVKTTRNPHYIQTSDLMTLLLACKEFSLHVAVITFRMSRRRREMYIVSQKGCHHNHGYNFVNSWRICKLLSLLQRAVNFHQNQYDLIQPAVPVRPLRSSDAPLLSAARTWTEFARRAFSVAAPHTWNSLPSDIRSCHTLHTFKKHIKTHLFRQS